ncbi:hypothetical protein FBUS_08578 [Fasciolopsis buskii]|uniref:NOT2/NOT3/NOT5 C-terminal domain-containing protein n=1 Tax=Fasciolopsis buskii TaxID=27845 RepID=A0A8E0VM08_9TREM|nr:hypothetical protein FBUS_08578 [Fasciolopsis buski]
MCTSYGRNRTALFGGTQSGVVGAPTFSDMATLCASGYSSRPGSSQQNGEVLGSLSGGFSVRSAFPSAQDHSAQDTASSFFNAVGFNGVQSGPLRNFSEPSLFPSLSSTSRTGGVDLSSGRIGSSSTAAKTVPTNDGLTGSSSRNPGAGGNLFAASLSGDSTTNNSANLSISSSTASRGMKLDPSEFPPILTSVGRSGNTPGSFPSLSTQPPLRNYVSIMSKGSPTTDVATSNSLTSQYSSSQPAPPEFSKQDFPALPGSNHHHQQQQHTSVPSTLATGQSSTNTLSAANSNPGLPRPIPLNASSSVGNRSSSSAIGPGSTGHFNSSHGTGPTTSGTSSGIQLLANHFVANISKNMICDQFGMIGLLKLIHIGAYDAALNMLAPGSDLSSLHNNWQTAGELHNTFVSPCHDSCIGRPQDMDYAVPPEYLIRHLIADRLPDPPMDQLSEETLFWLFYNCCREETQLVVAKELYQREWRFHKKEKIWLTRNVNANFTTDNSSEQGDYFYWDPQKAQKSTLHMTILYSDLDNAPKSFRLSSGTLNAFVGTGLTTNSAGHHAHHSNAHASVQQLQLTAAYQQQQHQQQQQQQQQQQNYNSHQSLLPSNHQPNSSGNAALMNTLHHSASGPLLGQGNTTTATGGSAASLATLFNSNTRHASKTQVSQISPSATYIQPTGMSHGRSAAALSNPVGPLFASRSGGTGTQQSMSSTATPNATTLVPGLITHNSVPPSSSATVVAAATTSSGTLNNPTAPSGTGSITLTTTTAGAESGSSGAADSSTIRSATSGTSLVITSLTSTVANDHPSVSASSGGSSLPLNASAQL